MRPAGGGRRNLELSLHEPENKRPEREATSTYLFKVKKRLAIQAEAQIMFRLGDKRAEGVYETGKGTVIFLGGKRFCWCR